jgi:hypothetical protein
VTEQRKKAAPGWYPHPSMADTQRYWDGEKWTDNVAPATAKKAETPSVDFRHWGGVLAICAAMAVAGLAMRDGDSTSEAGEVLLGLAAIVGVIALLKLGSEMVSRR